MTPQQLYTRFRSDVVDAATPYLWSDDEVWGYMDDAQKMLCRLTQGIRDASSSVTQVAITNGSVWCALDPSILFIRSAKLRSTDKPVRVFSYENLAGTDGTPVSWPWSVADMNRPGPIVAVIVGMEELKLRTAVLPTEDDTLDLVVERLPVTPIVSGVRSVTITNGGSLYTTAPTATFTGGGGTGAAGTAVLSSGAVASVTITNPGSGYTSAPTVGFTGGGGSNAAGTAVIGPPATFEVRDEHHLHLLLWMKHLAYAKQDADTFDKERSENAKMAFVGYCEQAGVEKRRRNLKPQLIAYGGL